MSEENKTVELNDDELKDVNGGYRVTVAHFLAGDCFESELYIYKVLNGMNDATSTDYINCVMYNKLSGTTITKTITAGTLCNYCAYIGKDKI